MTNGFVPLRRGVLEHCLHGKLPPLHFAAYVHLLLEADCSTGIAWSSGKALAARYGYDERYARDILERLEKMGYIKRFTTPGRHGNYPILINKYLASKGGRSGWLLNADKSTDYRNPVYEKREENSEGIRKEIREDNSSIQEREGELNTTSPAVPPSAGAATPEKAESTRPRPAPNPQDAENAAIVDQVYRHYLAVMGKKDTRYKLTDQRKKMLLRQARELRDTVRADNPNLPDNEVPREVSRLMCYAVDRLSESDWYMGRDPKTDGRRYDGLEYVFTKYERLEKWLNT